MTTINPAGAGSQAATAGMERVQIGKDDFLLMLITQLKHQDPLNPMDGTEFTAQLAQFTSLEQLANLNLQVEAMNKRQEEMDNMNSLSMIGKSVLTESNAIVADGGAVEITYRLKDDIAEGVVEIYTSDGTVVDSIDIGRRAPGEYSHSWNSDAVEAGNYAFRLTAKNPDGGYASWAPLVLGEVTGVSFKDKGVYLMVNGEEMPMSKVTVVRK